METPKKWTIRFPCIRRGATTKCRFHVLATPHLEQHNVSFRVCVLNKCEITSVWHKNAACICLCAFSIRMHVYSKELRALLNNLDLHRWITIFWLQFSSIQFCSNFKRMIHPSMLSTEQIFLVPAFAFNSKKDHRCLWGEKPEQNWGWIERTWGWCQDRQRRIKRRSSRTLALDI